MGAKVTEIENGTLPVEYEPYVPGKEDLKHEYQFSIAHHMIENLLRNGQITQVEFNKLELKFRKKYVPHLAEVMPEIR